LDIDDDNLCMGGLTIGELKEKYGITRTDLLSYASPDPKKLLEAGIEFHYMSYYRKWNLQENYQYALRHTGFQPNPERTPGTYGNYCGLDDKIEPLHYYMKLIKFGLGRATVDAAIDIRSKNIAREEGVALVRKYDAEFPREPVMDVLEYINIDEEMFWVLVDGFRSPHLWKYDGGEWLLRYQVM